MIVEGSMRIFAVVNRESGWSLVGIQVKEKVRTSLLGKVGRRYSFYTDVGREGGYAVASGAAIAGISSGTP